MRRTVIGVMGSGTDEHADLAEPLGRWLATRGYDLLTGAGPGVMSAVSRAFSEVPGRRGIVLGIVPAGRPDGLYPNPWVEIPIFTHLSGQGGPLGSESRNHINVLSSDVIVALPGAVGTQAEIELAVRYEKAIIAYWPAATRDQILADVPIARELEEVKRFVVEKG